ncbi:MAG: hypothetical protein ACTHLA_01565 [Asticcacaulis sp.]|uniref:hypothetical protein n=1 Tax=Asticcacaulis sp. TaxID=1872648 RepID=UPI003F7C8B05
MKTTIGKYNDKTRQVPVKFVEGGVTHNRDVNACHDDSGKYDAKATASRVEEVARGVAHKIAIGVIS